MKKYSLTELEKIKSKLETWIKNDRLYLGEYKEFYFRDGEYYFFISFTGLHKNTTQTKLDDLWDTKTGEPLPEKTRQNIKSICEKIYNEENRLKTANEKILRFYLGDDFSVQNYKSQKSRNRVTDKKRIEQYLAIAFKLNDIPKGEKYLDKTMYRKLGDKQFLINLTTTLQKKKESNYNYSTDKIYLIDILYNHFAAKLLRIVKKESIVKKQPQDIEYSDDLDFNKPYKKKPKSTEY